MIFISQIQELKIDKIQPLYFYASWMPYHKNITVMIDYIENKHNAKFLAIDVDYFKDLCKRFNIESIPTILILLNNKEIGRIIGYEPFAIFKKYFADIYHDIA